ncbi:MAG: terpene cyclase/mutase family protein [Planctomycetes bacterium]|nr:terpene cyclase/mutase family protein [Planctomycetota bacterium]
MRMLLAPTLILAFLLPPPSVRAEGQWEITPESEVAIERGLEWLARNQGPDGNWESNDLGLVSMGTLAFLAAGHMPGRGRYGDVVEKSLDYVVRNSKPSGLLNISNGQRDMYNHGLATFVLGQAYGMTADPRVGKTLDRALKLIYNTQCEDGGWDYHARRQQRGHDLSLAVMQAKAIRSAVDSGLEVPPEVVQLAVRSVREHYKASNGARGFDPRAQEGPGQFTYDGNRGTTAMAAAGVVCLQEYGQYDDWRIPKTMDVITPEIKRLKMPNNRDGRLPFDAYTLYYVGQALYQVGDQQSLGRRDWSECYPILRDHLVKSQGRKPGDPREDGWWTETRHVGGKPGQMWGTATACFILAMPNRYLPILQEGKIESLKQLGSE